MLGNGILVQIEGSLALYSSQVTATTSPTPLPAQACSELVVQSDPGNTVNVLVGNNSSQYVVLEPGDSITLCVSNANLVYHKATSASATLNILARS